MAYLKLLEIAGDEANLSMNQILSTCEEPNQWESFTKKLEQIRGKFLKFAF